MNANLTLKDNCRVCLGPMNDVLSLGDIIPVDFIPAGQPVREPAPLVLAECTECHLVQLRHTCHRDTLFRQYWYLSGLNASMVESLRDVLMGIETRAQCEKGDVVIDIGANDGTLLGMYHDDVVRIGFDPAVNLADSARAKCDQFYNDFFESTDVQLPKAKVITSIAMFYDLDEPRSFCQKISETLSSNGIWVMQMTDLTRMLQANAFDNICHEHLCYYSLAIFKNLIEQYGLELFDVETNDVNGASIRCYIGHRGAHAIDPRVGQELQAEQEYLQAGSIARFSRDVEEMKARTVRFIRNERAEGKVFHALGASTKGNTLLQYYGLGPDDIECAAEVNEAKYGLRMAGSNVPIIAQQESLDKKPDYYLVLPWHFMDFFLRKHEAYLKSGGAFIRPLPTPEQYTMEESGAHEGGYAVVERSLGPTV